MKVFLTGASGYVGRHVAQELVSRGHEVTGLARRASPSTDGLNNIEWCFADLAEFNEFEGLIDRADVIIHCALNYSDSGDVNTDLDADFVQQLQAKEKYFIYTGNLFSPRPDPAGTFIEETVPESDDWRLQQEISILESSSSAAVIRLGFVYGGRGGYLWQMLPPEAVSGLDPNEIVAVNWPMVHVQDVAALFATIAEQKATGIYHAYDGTPITAREIVQTLKEIYPPAETPPQAPHEYVWSLLKNSIETTHTRALSTGWEPQFSNFRENAAQAYASYVAACL